MKKPGKVTRIVLAGICFVMLPLGGGKAAASGSVATIYVSPDGSAGGDGTKDSPYSSIQTAINSLTDGQGAEIVLRGGTYTEKIVMKKSGSEETPIHITSYEGEQAVIDGCGGTGTLINLYGKSNIVIEDVALRNMKGTTSNAAIAIYGMGGESNITIKDCEIYEINTVDPKTCNADAISIRASAGKSENINILNNYIHDSDTGWSEAVALNGYVDTAVIAGNRIENIGNIGIDIAGHYGVYKIAAYDQADNVTVSGNVITNCVSPNCVSAAGVYCDGGKNVVIEDNIITDCQVGISVGCEESDKGYPVTNVTVDNNVVYGSTYCAFEIGGYASSSGTVENSVVTSNTFYTNNSSNCAVHITKTDGITFVKNLIATPYSRVMSYDVSQSYINNIEFEDNLFSTSANSISSVTVYVLGVSEKAAFTDYVSRYSYLPLSQVSFADDYGNDTGYGYEPGAKEEEAETPEEPDIEETPEMPEESGAEETPELPEGSEEETVTSYSHNYSDGLDDEYFTSIGNLKASAVSLNGMEFTEGMKCESSSEVTFTMEEEGTLLVVLTPQKSIKIDGTAYTAGDDGVITIFMKAGSHIIKKVTTNTLVYYLQVDISVEEHPEEDEDSTEEAQEDEEKPKVTSQTLMFGNFTTGKLLESVTEGVFTLHATEKKTMEITAGSYAAEDGTQFEGKLRLNGAGSVDTRNIEIQVEREDSRVVIYAANSSTSGSLLLVNGQGQVVKAVTPDSLVTCYEFESLLEGNYYLYADGGNITVYQVALEGE